MACFVNILTFSSSSAFHSLMISSSVLFFNVVTMAAVAAFGLLVSKAEEVAGVAGVEEANREVPVEGVVAADVVDEAAEAK